MEQQQREQGHQYTASTQASHLGRGVGQVAPQVKWLQQAYKVAQKGGAQAHPRAGQRQPRWGLIGLVVGGGCVYYVVNLEQVPATGRWRFLDVSIAEELQMGKDAYEGTMQQFGGQLLSSLSPSSMQVHRVAKRIIAACEELDVERAANAKPTEWTIHVVDDPEQKNAFVLPGGHIFVFTGILPVCENDAGLATVMSHEIAHQIARHSAEKMAGTKILMAGAFVLDMMGLDIGLSRILLNLILSLPNSRKLESEADHLGLRIMAKACYDPKEAVDFWGRMDASETHGGRITESAKALISTHPVNSQRIAKIQSWLPEAENEFSSNRCGTSAADLSAMFQSSRLSSARSTA